MKCHEAKRHLDLFMDGELSVPENLKVLEHLNLCRACSGVYEGEKALRAALRSRVGSVQAPAGLAERLASSIEVESAPVQTFRRPSPWRLISIAAAAIPFFIALLFLFTSPIEKPQAFATDAVTQHNVTREGFCGQHRDDCVCVCDNCCSEEAAKAIGRFQQKQVGFETCNHDLSGLGYKPIGASVWRHRGQKVCWTVQRDEAGHTITHGLLTTKIAMEPGPMLVCDGVDRPVVLIPSGGGMTCAFVFDSEDEAVRFRAWRKK